MNVFEIIVAVLQVAAMLLAAPLVTGIIKKLKAKMQHRVGASILQPYRDLRKLMRKETVVSESASPMFRVIPYICMLSMVLLALMVPFVYSKVLSPYSDLIAMVYIFTMFRFAMVLGGLEGGSTFGGMGSSREVMMSILIEPALLLSIMTLSAITHAGFNVSAITEAMCSMGALAIGPALLLAGSSFVITMVAENARVPFDNPDTHLELTMVHEGMILEYSGRGLAMMEYSSMLRLMLFMTMMGTLFFPWGVATTLDPLALLIALVTITLKLLLFAFVIAFIESTVAKMRLFKIPNLLTASFTLSLLAMISLYVL